MRKIVEDLSAKALPHSILLELVAVTKEKRPDNGELVTMPMGFRHLPIKHGSYFGKNKEIVDDTVYEGETFFDSDVRGVQRTTPKTIAFNQMGNLVIPENKPGLYEFVKNHPLNVSNPNLTDAQVQQAMQHPCAFREVTSDVVYRRTEKVNKIRIELLKAITPNGTSQASLIDFTGGVLGIERNKVENQLQELVEKLALTGTNSEAANPLLFEAWYDSLNVDQRTKEEVKPLSENQSALNDCFLCFVKMGKFTVTANGPTGKTVKTESGVVLFELSSIKEPKINSTNEKEKNAENLLSIIDNDGGREKLPKIAETQRAGEVTEYALKFISLFE